MSVNDIQKRLSQMEGWKSEGNSISKKFETNDFAKGMEFLRKVADVAENMDHHPDVFLSYSYIKFILTTHSEDGITSDDFDLAEMIDRIYEKTRQKSNNHLNKQPEESTDESDYGIVDENDDFADSDGDDDGD